MDKHKLNIVVAHKPIYEICETARLSYKRYMKTPFMANLQEYIGDKGFYLCGDKHTRSIIDTAFHDVNHYLAGEPLSHDIIEYNLIELSDCEIGMERKLHLEKSKVSKDSYICTIRPQDKIVSALFKCSQEYIIENSFDIIGIPHSPISWEKTYQAINGWSGKQKEKILSNLNRFYSSICKYRKGGRQPQNLENKNIFDFVSQQLENAILF